MRYTLIFTNGREEAKFGRLYKLVLIAKKGKIIHIQAVRIPKLSAISVVSKSVILRTLSIAIME